MGIVARPVTAGEAIAVGLVVTGTSSFTVLDGPTDQAGTAAVKPRGIAQTSAAASGDAVVVVERGDATALAGDTVAAGDVCVAEYNTGRLIPYSAAAYTDGTEIYTAGRAKEAATDGVLFQFDVDIQLHTIPTPA
jgi:hypothetical protein